MFVPFISTYFSETRGFSVSFIGIVLAIRIATQQGLAMWGGYLADRLGNTTVARLGFFIRGLGFIGIGIASNGAIVLASAALSGLGGALFSPSLRAAIAYNSNPESQKESYAMMNIAENTGAVLGPMFGSFFFNEQFAIVSITTGGLFFILSIYCGSIPNVSTSGRNPTFIAQVTSIVKDKNFLFLFFGMIPYYFINQQLYISIPIVAQKNIGSTNWIFPFVTLLVVFFQMSIIKSIAKKSAPFIFSLSYFCMSLFLIPLCISVNLISIMLCLVGISLGTMLLVPSYQTLTIRSAPIKLVASYLGFSSLAMAIGGISGNIIGGALLDYFIFANQQELFWIMLFVLSIIPLIVLSVMNKKGKVEYIR